MKYRNILPVAITKRYALYMYIVFYLHVIVKRVSDDSYCNILQNFWRQIKKSSIRQMW